MDFTELQQEYIKCANDSAYFLNHYGYVFDAKKKKVGRMTCFGYQEDCLKKYHENKNNIVLKSRQCVPENTLIDTPHSRIPIQTLKKGDAVISYNLKNSTIEEDVIEEVWCSGERQCIIITFEDGREIEVGENHPLYVKSKEDWISSISLRIGDEILDVKENRYSIIKSIKQSGIKVCYDISVKKNENFFIDGVLVHNTGLSVITAGYVAWRMIFRRDERILIVADNGTGAVRFLKAVKVFLTHTPKWMMPGNGEFLAKNTKHVQLENNSEVEAKASSSEAGRGDSLTLFVFDEVAFADYAEDIWTAAGLALSMTDGKAIFLSTPNGTSGLYHSTWVNAEPMGFARTEVHWTQNPYCSEGLETRTNEKGEKYHWSPWYEEQCQRFNYDSVKIAQELDLSFEGSKRLAIEPDLVSKYEKRLMTDEYKEIIKNKCYYDYNAIGNKFVDYETPFIVFKKPQPKASYIIGGDVGRGDANDYSTLQVLDVLTMEIVAEYRDKISPDLFAVVAYNIANAYNKAYVSIESNSFGLATNLDLNRKMKYKNMSFCKNVKDIYVPAYDYRVPEEEMIPGFQTTKKTKPLIINSLVANMREGELKIYSDRTLAEFRTFVQKDEKIGAESGYNDDLIIALAIALFMRDTEFKSLALSDSMHKAMMESFGYASTTTEGKRINAVKPEEIQKKEEQPVVIGGIYVNTTNSGENTNNDDLNWLLAKKL